MRSALILSHPGHELRIYKFLEVHQPLVYVLTDGSGAKAKSQIDSTAKVLQKTGASPGKVFGRFTDREFHEVIFHQKIGILYDLIEELEEDLKARGIELLAGDACEGFHPTHDLCRYLINALASRCGLENYDFTIEGPPHECPNELKKKALWIYLSDEDVERKLAGATHYPELLPQVKGVLRRQGRTPFLTECLRPVEESQRFKTWETPLPFYESYTTKQAKEGKNCKVISFEKHLRPLAEKISIF